MTAGTFLRPIEGTSLRCTCCGRRKKLGEIDGQGLEIIAKVSGEKHTCQASPMELLEALAGTVGGMGVLAWVRELFSNGYTENHG